MFRMPLDHRHRRLHPVGVARAAPDRSRASPARRRAPPRPARARCRRSAGASGGARRPAPRGSARIWRTSAARWKRSHGTEPNWTAWVISCRVTQRRSTSLSAPSWVAARRDVRAPTSNSRGAPAESSSGMSYSPSTRCARKPVNPPTCTDSTPRAAARVGRSSSPSPPPTWLIELVEQGAHRSAGWRRSTSLARDQFRRRQHGCGRSEQRVADHAALRVQRDLAAIPAERRAPPSRASPRRQLRDAYGPDPSRSPH